MLATGSDDASLVPLPPDEPHGSSDPAVRAARAEAVSAILAAEDAERRAKEARKQAKWKTRRYERLLAEREATTCADPAEH